MHLLILRFRHHGPGTPIKRGRGGEIWAWGGLGGAANVTEGAGQAPPPTGCLPLIHLSIYLSIYLSLSTCIQSPVGREKRAVIRDGY